jgi:D-lactate dehydrogenase
MPTLFHNKSTKKQPFIGFKQGLQEVLIDENIIESELLRYAYGTDASFYRLTPKLVLRVENTKQLQAVIKLAVNYQQALTFRAAGTSLSGQAVTDQILVILSAQWNNITISDQGELITLQPGVIGASANKALNAFQRKIGPDPASINSCKIGGIAANNASGMCCGVKHNSYHTLAAMTIIFADGAVLNTADQKSRQQYLQNHQEQIKQLKDLINQLNQSTDLVAKIRHKYRLKNTTGYGINALIDFDDIIDIISHLMIGSEGTLAFIADITYHTIPIKPFKMAALYVFDQLSVACQFVKNIAIYNVDAAEIMDSSALHAVKPQLTTLLNLDSIDHNSAALLIEISSDELAELELIKQQIITLLTPLHAHLLPSQHFTQSNALITELWQIRKGLFPAVGAHRKAGTTVIIEDVAFELDVLAQAVEALQQLLREYGYNEAIIFGHALAGNLHFVFTQAFTSQTEINRYDAFMQALSLLVTVEFSGSLKAEHGTGRNMAPFVELEWGQPLYHLMKQIKQIFDPNNILNPNVIINADKKCHIKQLKALPAVETKIDKCIECGFCEPVCPSKNYTLTPRQRIALWRKITQLQQQGQQKGLTKTDENSLRHLNDNYQHYGIDSCAATGLCAQACPVGIDTGEFIKSLRAQANTTKKTAYLTANYLADHFALVSAVVRAGLSIIDFSQQYLGKKIVYRSFKLLNKVSANRIPLWHSAWPKAVKKTRITQLPFTDKVLYIPSCANRIFAAENNAKDQRSLLEVFCSVLNKAKIEVIIPEGITGQCCGLPWFSKGFPAIALEKRNAFMSMIASASQNGKMAIVTDASPCASSLIDTDNTIKIYELSHYIAEYVLPKLAIKPTNEAFMLHKSCSSLKMDNGAYLEKIANICSKNIIIPQEITCCGFAGDKGFYLPALNKSALAPLTTQIPKQCQRGLSNSRSCEIGLSAQSNISYQSFLYLVDEVSVSL